MSADTSDRESLVRALRMVKYGLGGRLGAAQMAMAEWEAAVAALEAGIALDPASIEMVSWRGAGYLVPDSEQT